MPFLADDGDLGGAVQLPAAPARPVIPAASPPIVQLDPAIAAAITARAAPPATPTVQPTLTLSPSIDVNPLVVAGVPPNLTGPFPGSPVTTSGPVDAPPDHRGLPQPGDIPENIGPIVAPHPPGQRDSGSGDGGTTTVGTTDSGGTDTGGGDRTLASATTGDPNDHRQSAAAAWLHFGQFFGGELPHFAGQTRNLRLSLPKVVG